MSRLEYQNDVSLKDQFIALIFKPFKPEIAYAESVATTSKKTTEKVSVIANVFSAISDFFKAIFNPDTVIVPPVENTPPTPSTPTPVVPNNRQNTPDVPVVPNQNAVVLPPPKKEQTSNTVIPVTNPIVKVPTIDTSLYARLRSLENEVGSLKDRPSTGTNTIQYVYSGGSYSVPANVNIPTIPSTYSSQCITGTMAVGSGGTGTSTAPTLGQVLLGNANGTYNLVATSLLGIVGGGSVDVNALDPIEVGFGNSATGASSTAMGYCNTASGCKSSASGFCNIASGYKSSASGYHNTASSYFSSAIGALNTASGYRSSAFGTNNTASGYCSSASGYKNTASACLSSAFGSCLTNATASSTMLGVNTGYIKVLSNGSIVSSIAGACLSTGGTWTNASSRDLKENFTDVNSDEVLAKINALNIQKWNYKVEDSTITHIGPIAQDFYAAFNLGGSDKSISTIDPAGVALIGIQALSKRLDSIQGPTLFDSLSVNLATSTPEETSSWNNIFTALKSFGAEIIDGIAYLKNVFIEKLTVNTVKVQKGIEMKSPDGTTYCVTIDNNGEFQKDRGDCDAPDPVVPTVSTGGGSSDTGTPAP
ncbi:MAG: tail fiber domain-containing protein, partial [bacterium]